MQQERQWIGEHPEYRRVAEQLSQQANGQVEDQVSTPATLGISPDQIFLNADKETDAIRQRYEKQYGFSLPYPVVAQQQREIDQVIAARDRAIHELDMEQIHQNLQSDPDGAYKWQYIQQHDKYRR